MKYTIALTLGLVMGAVIALSAVAYLQPTDALTPCPHEDSVGCYWDASERGNGLGNDFISPHDN